MQRLGDRLPPLHRVEIGVVPVGEPCPSCGLDTCPCRKCHGAQWVVNHRWEDGKPQELVPCACYSSELTGKRLGALAERGHLRNLEAVTFDALKPHQHQRDSWARCLSYASQPEGWLLLRGDAGGGKTTLAIAIANERLKYGASAVFQTVPDLLEFLRQGYSGNDEQERLERIRSCSVLVLDDLGAEHQTEWASERLFMILNARSQPLLPTVLTTNLLLGDLEYRLRRRLTDPTICTIIEVRTPGESRGRRS